MIVFSIKMAQKDAFFLPPRNANAAAPPPRCCQAAPLQAAYDGTRIFWSVFLVSFLLFVPSQSWQKNLCENLTKTKKRCKKAFERPSKPGLAGFEFHTPVARDPLLNIAVPANAGDALRQTPLF
jgi:hypothetical protein